MEYGPSTHVNSLVSTHPSTPQRCAEAERASLTFHPTVHTLTVYVAFGAARPAYPVGWLGGSIFSRSAPGCSVHWTGTSGGPGNALARAPKVRSALRPSNSAPEPPFHTRADPLLMPGAHSYDLFSALDGYGGRRRGRRRSRRSRCSAGGTQGGVRAATRARMARAPRVSTRARQASPGCPTRVMRVRASGGPCGRSDASWRCGIGRGVVPGHFGADGSTRERVCGPP